MKTKIYKIELMVVDFDERFVEDILSGLENCKYIHPKVISLTQFVKLTGTTGIR